MLKINTLISVSALTLALSTSAFAQAQTQGQAQAPKTNEVKSAPAAKPADVAKPADAEKVAPQKAFVPKIGFVNTNKLLSESAPAKEAERKIEEEFKKRDTELQKLANDLRTKYENFDKNAPVMTDSDRAKAQRELTDLDTNLQRKRREFQEDFNRRRQDAFAQIVDKANRAIQDIASEEDYDIIIQEAVAVSDRVDITDKVIKALETKK
ncbi:OmpH family outer membrane protein [Taylorella asinigenitalis]|uniref:Putative outer membrane protein n=1 Tax=Taylorella asinigenitalis (strain MCE3) TaxID=1008459 RepID=G4Q9N3_TAYAM|nr:OmpH family outer membrane protein [Taylorella asinigenitalis]AEP36649.1 putative outer membrane protein [Taylorella asinigenitalis MCE3]